MRIFLNAICLIAALAASACASSDRSTRGGPSGASLNGMVYDYENRPVADAEIRIDGHLRARSDINGRFSLGELPFGKYAVEVGREGCERVSFAVTYGDPTQIIYVKLYSAKQLLSAAEKEMEKRNWAEAQAYLGRMEAIGADDPAARYLRAVLSFRRGQAKEAKGLLEALLADGYDEAYVHLFLADLCQYSFSDPRGAAAQLEKYLKARYDPDVERRLRELRGADTR